MSLRPATACSVVGLLLLLAACGSSGSSSSSPSSSDGGPDGAACGNPGQCPTEGACCTRTVPDGFGPEGFRCAAGAWKSDTSCLPPPAACESPVTGSLTRGDGRTVAATCFIPLAINGVVAAAVAITPGGQLELYFDRMPGAGDVLPVYPYAKRSEHQQDAGSTDPDAGANAVAMRIGSPGCFSGFAVEAESASGTVTVTSVRIGGAGISMLDVTIDAQLTSATPASPWSGKLTGSF